MAGTNEAAHRSAVEYEQHWWSELIRGTEEQLQALGIGDGMAFPGEPGARKMRVTVLPDGTMPTSRTGEPHEARMPGAKKIERVSKGTYQVRIVGGEDEGHRRYCLIERARCEHQRRTWALPRPAPLHGVFDARPGAERAAARNALASAEVDPGFRVFLAQLGLWGSQPGVNRAP